MNTTPATIPTHAKTWLSRLGPSYRPDGGTAGGGSTGRLSEATVVGSGRSSGVSLMFRSSGPTQCDGYGSGHECSVTAPSVSRRTGSGQEPRAVTQCSRVG